MMDKIFLNALSEAIRDAGSQTALAKRSGMQQSRISDYISGRYDFYNITIGTLYKLFPDMSINYFKKAPEYQIKHHNIEVGGKVTGTIQQSGNAPIFGSPESQANYELTYDHIRMLAKNLRKDDRFSDSEKMKILDFLDDQL